MAIVASGFIIYRISKSQIQYLLLQASGGHHHWTPPKGHVERGETELEAAYRETQEESGLKRSQLRVVDGFKKTIEYRKGGMPKKVVYWLAELRDLNAEVVLSGEHQAYNWLSIEEIQQGHAVTKHPGYAGTQQVLNEADAFIRSVGGT